MEENKDLKKVKILYVVVIGLILLLLGMFYYFQNRINEVENHAGKNSELFVNFAVRMNKIVELNHLDTDRFAFLSNPKDWEKELEKQIGMTIDVPETWKLDEVIVRKDVEENKYDYYIITMTKSDKYLFNEFTTELYKKIHDKFGEVDTFKEGKGYYEILSFSEATYNNMYYDYIVTNEEGIETGTKPKIKILDQEDNKVQIEINKF